jgi:hypothetical protein
MTAARDFCLCLSPDYVTASVRAGETAVYSYAKTAQGAKRALDYAKKALETCAGLYGAYLIRRLRCARLPSRLAAWNTPACA